MAQSTDSASEPREIPDKVYVYEGPVRAWHWLTVLCIIVMCVTGYLIGKPPLSVPGEASFHFEFGYIRMIHFATGQILALALIYRVVWAFLGNRHSHQIFLPPLFSRRWWSEIGYEIRWYLFLAKTPKKYIGHNPLAQLSMFLLFVLPLFNAIFTGLALYAEGQGTDSWWYGAFGWVFAVYGDSFFVHTVHRLTMWVIIAFSMIHIYLAIREDIMSRQSMVSTMISGWRYFKDDRE